MPSLKIIGLLEKKISKGFTINEYRLTLPYFSARSNWVAYTFEWGKLLQSYLMGKTCSKGLNILNKCVHDWEGGKKIYINGPGCMTKMAAMPIYGKNLQ